eukprot:3589218-Pyramimonas_sp.AAC.1
MSGHGPIVIMRARQEVAERQKLFLTWVDIVPLGHASTLQCNRVGALVLKFQMAICTIRRPRKTVLSGKVVHSGHCLAIRGSASGLRRQANPLERGSQQRSAWKEGGVIHTPPRIWVVGGNRLPPRLPLPV